jgi:hypothetical protein
MGNCMIPSPQPSPCGERGFSRMYQENLFGEVLAALALLALFLDALVAARECVQAW